MKRTVGLVLGILLTTGAAHAAEGEPSTPTADPAADPASAPTPAPTSDPTGAPTPEAPPPPPPADNEPTVVTVAGTKVARTSGSAHVIRKDQLERFRYDDPHAVLLGVPGVYVRGEDGFGLRPNIGIRGAISDRSKKIALMEDGVLFGPAPYSAPAAYYFPLIGRMEAVRVIKGPASITYGPQTVGGAVDLVTKEIPWGQAGSIDLAIGQYGYRKLHGTVGGSTETLGFLLEGVHLGSTGFKELDGGGDTGFTRNEWMLKARWVPDPEDRDKNELRIKVGYSDEVSHETYLGLSDADFRADPYRRYRASAMDRMKWHRTQVVLTHNIQPAKNFTITTTAYRMDLHRVWRKLNAFRGAALYDLLLNPDTARNAIFHEVLQGRVDSSSDAETLLIGPNDRTFVSQGVQSIFKWNVSTGPIAHRVEYGLRYHYDEIARRHTQDGFLMVGGALVPDGQPTETTALNTASTHALSAHVIDAMTLGPATLTPGVRFESIRSRYDDLLSGTYSSAHTFVVLPGVGGYYGLTRDFGLLAGVYKGFSPAPPGSPGVAPESSVNYEAGARYSAKRLRAEIIGFYNDYSNITNICTLSEGCVGSNLDRQFDGGQARIYGFESYVEATPRAGADVGFPLRASYTLTRTEFLNDFDSQDPIFGKVSGGDEMPYVPKHQASGSVGIETKTWGLNAAGTYVGWMREVAGKGEPPPNQKTDAYFVLDASGFYRFTRWLQLYVNGRNLLNQAYLVSRRPFGARPGAPLWVQVGVKAEF